MFNNVTNLTDHKCFFKSNKSYLFVFYSSTISIIYKELSQTEIIDIKEIEHGVFNKAAIKILDDNNFLISFYNNDKINTYLFEKEEDL